MHNYGKNQEEVNIPSDVTFGYTRICKYCGKDFSSSNSYTKYCSSECSFNANKAEMTCKVCGKKFIGTKSAKYCSDECRYVIYPSLNKQREKKIYKKICPTCGKEFLGGASNAIYCSRECHIYKLKCMNCGEEYYSSFKISKFCSDECKNAFQTSEKICVICGKKFIGTKSVKYCSDKCRRLSIQKYYNKQLSFDRRCPYCEKIFTTDNSSIKYCSPECKKHAGHERKERKKQIRKINKDGIKRFTNFGDLIFWSEKEFEHWFKQNYVLFGIKRIIKMDSFFPDVLAETYTGKKLRIELEFNASNFIDHGHDPNMCDMIISFMKSSHITNIRGVPVISIFNSKGLRGGTHFDINSLKLTSYFQDFVEFCQNKLNNKLKK